MTAFWEVQELIGRWWFTYDQGLFEQLDSLLTDDVHFTVRSDTGKTEYEEFITANVHGKSDVMIWHAEHRLDSPSPLRHNGTNVHLTGTRGDDLEVHVIHIRHSNCRRTSVESLDGHRDGICQE